MQIQAAGSAMTTIEEPVILLNATAVKEKSKSLLMLHICGRHIFLCLVVLAKKKTALMGILFSFLYKKSILMN